MPLICTEELVHARLAERLAEIDLATATVRRPAGRRRLGRRRRLAASASIT
jgi:hypothetical protein